MADRSKVAAPPPASAESGGPPLPVVADGRDWNRIALWLVGATLGYNVIESVVANRLLTVESAKHLDKLVRAGRWQDAQELVDAVLLKSYLGLSPEKVMLLRSAIGRLDSIRRFHAVDADEGAELPAPVDVGESVARP